MKLTDASVRDLHLPRGAADKVWFDDELGGFGVRLREGGTRSWIVQYDFGGKTEKITLGSTKKLSQAQARASAKKIFAAVGVAAPHNSVRRGGTTAGKFRHNTRKSEAMSNDLIITSTDDGWGDAAAKQEASVIRGTLLKFSDWRWSKGKESTKVEDCTKLVALQTTPCSMGEVE